MTCIVGLHHNGRVYLGGDSAGVAGRSVTIRADQKVFRNGPYIMGFTTSFRMGQLLRYAFDAPKVTGDLDRFMTTSFVDAVRTCLKAGGWLSTDKERIDGGTFLVGVSGVLFEVHGDFQVGRPLNGYQAVGCGDDLALGSLHTSKGRSPRWRINAALEAAAHHSTGVAGPFTVEASR